MANTTERKSKNIIQMKFSFSFFWNYNAMHIHDMQVKDFLDFFVFQLSSTHTFDVKYIKFIYANNFFTYFLF